MLFRRYSNIEYLFNLSFNEFIDFLNMAIDKERDEKIYKRWLVELPFMGRDNFVSFDEFKDKLTPKRKLSDIEQVSIVSNAYAILEKTGGG